MTCCLSVSPELREDKGGLANPQFSEPSHPVFVSHFPPLWPPDEVPLDAVLPDEVPLDAVLPDEVPLDAALLDEVVLAEPPLPPPPAGDGCGLSSALYAVGLKPITLILSRLRSSLLPYNAVLLLLAVLGRLEHPTIPNKDALTVIQSNR